jgi:hypothetical protein
MFPTPCHFWSELHNHFAHRFGKQRIATQILVPCCTAYFLSSFSGSKFENNMVGKLLAAS